MRLLLVDGHYYLYRSFFAIRGLKNSRGEPTNAIYGFIKAIRKMLADVRPDRAAVVWDAGLPARRVELQPAYKQNRSSMPEDLRPQEDLLQKNICLLGTQGVELLMWLATRAALTHSAASGVRKVHSNYHIPISNTATGLIALETVA